LDEREGNWEARSKEKGGYVKPEDIPKKVLFDFIKLGETTGASKKGQSKVTKYHMFWTFLGWFVPSQHG
jgi:hypothetical protein